MSGRKDDDGKIRFDLIDPHFTEGVAKVLTHGAAHYSPNNWKLVEDAKHRYTAAVHRHLNSWQRGEDLDRHSGLHHLEHVACNIMFLLYGERNEGFDVRPDEDRSDADNNELRGDSEDSVRHDDEARPKPREDLAEITGLYSWLRTHISPGTYWVYDQSDGGITVFSSPDNTSPSYVTHLSQPTLSELFRLAYSRKRKI